MISSRVTVMGSLCSVEGTQGPSPGPPKWWTCNLNLRTGRTSSPALATATRVSAEVPPEDRVAGEDRDQRSEGEEHPKRDGTAAVGPLGDDQRDPDDRRRQEGHEEPE